MGWALHVLLTTVGVIGQKRFVLRRNLAAFGITVTSADHPRVGKTATACQALQGTGTPVTRAMSEQRLKHALYSISTSKLSLVW